MVNNRVLILIISFPTTSTYNTLFSVCKDIPNCVSGHKECGTSIDIRRCNKCYGTYYSGGWGGGCRRKYLYNAFFAKIK